VEENEIYPLIGDGGFRRLVAAFYRQVPHDDILGPIYPRQDFAGAEERLRNFLIYRFGGPPVYIEERGHPRLRMRHAPFPVDRSARNRWMQLMKNALAEVSLPAEAERILTAYFESTATFMLNRAEEQPDSDAP
jgi:hemoglobin